METRTMKNGDIRQIAFTLEGHWEEYKLDIRVSGRTMYNLIALKRHFAERAVAITESFMVIGQSHGGEIQPDGSMKIPDENIEEVNKLLTEVALEEQEIQYKPIVLSDNDSLPADLMDLLFDFIVMED